MANICKVCTIDQISILSVDEINNGVKHGSVMTDGGAEFYIVKYLPNNHYMRCLGDYSFESEVSINFCPMCGRRLNK